MKSKCPSSVSQKSSSKSLQGPTKFQLSKYAYSNLSLLSKLSKGLSSSVYLAKTASGEKVAVKIFKSQAEEDFYNELNFYSLKITSPNIIKYYSCGSIKNQKDKHYGLNYITMEYSRHGDLFTFLEKNGKICETSVKKIIVGILDGLEVIHSNGLVHRDIKPENILIIDGEYKISDFGLCEEIDKFSCKRKGTHGYIPPEILEKRKIIPEAIDSFGLGVLAFTLITREFPFNHPILTDPNYCYIIDDDWESYWTSVGGPNIVSSHFRDLFSNLVCYNPERRYTLQEIRKSDWLKNFKV